MVGESSVPRLLFISGFLGAGKTTCIAWIARTLAKEGQRLAIVSNDQSDGLIDSQIAALHATSVQVAGGCFCCRSDELAGILKRLTAEMRPNVILAEPVGSCTDLSATLIHPLREIYKLPLRIAPLAAVADSRRARALFLGGGRRSLEKEVGYIWQKQLEEAEMIVLNKADLVSAEDMKTLQKRVGQSHPQARIFTVSATTGRGMKAWLEALLGATTAAAETVDVDYGIYARGEALLGWVNMEARLCAKSMFAPGAVLVEFAEKIQRALEKRKNDIAHLKMSFVPERKGMAALTVVNLTMNGEPVRLSRKGAARARNGKLLVNLRAVGAPAELAKTVRDSAARLCADLEWIRCEAFSPAEPKPIHRIQKK